MKGKVNNWFESSCLLKSSQSAMVADNYSTKPWGRDASCLSVVCVGLTDRGGFLLFSSQVLLIPPRTAVCGSVSAEIRSS